MGRAPCCDKASVKKGPWAPEEDAVLKAFVDAHGTGGNWIALPHKIGLNRCGKSCRLRWLNYLRPNIRHGGFTEEEDMLICSLYINIGSRWSTIAAQLPGRTDNDIKNYWNTKLKRRLLGGGRRTRGALLPQQHLLLASPTGGEAATSHISLGASALGRMQLSLQLQRSHGGRLHDTPAFTFYNNLAAPPWQNQPSLSPAASDSSKTMQLRHLSSTTTNGYSGTTTNGYSGTTTNGYSGFWSHIQSSSSYANVGVQEGTWDSSGTPPLSTSTGEMTAGVESSSSTPTASSVTFGNMDDEINMLLQQIRSFGESDDQIGGEAADGIDDHFFRAMIDETAVDGSVGSWSSCSTPGVDSVLQDYVQGYRQ